MNTLLMDVEILNILKESSPVALCRAQDTRTRRVMAERIRDKARNKRHKASICLDEFCDGMLLAAEMLEEG